MNNFQPFQESKVLEIWEHPFAGSSRAYKDDHHRSVNLCNPWASKHHKGVPKIPAGNMVPDFGRIGWITDIRKGGVADRLLMKCPDARNQNLIQS